MVVAGTDWPTASPNADGVSTIGAKVADAAQAYFRDAGFDVGPLVAQSFAVSGPQSLFESVFATPRLRLDLPIANARVAVSARADRWLLKCDVLNAFDERWFRARTGDTLGDNLVSAMPGRRWQLTLRTRF